MTTPAPPRGFFLALGGGTLAPGGDPLPARLASRDTAHAFPSCAFQLI